MTKKEKYQEKCKSIVEAIEELQNALNTMEGFNGLSEEETKEYLWDSIQNGKALPNDYALGKPKPPIEEILPYFNNLIIALNLLDEEYRVEYGLDFKGMGYEMTEWFKTEFISTIATFLCSYNQKTTDDLIEFVNELENLRSDITTDAEFEDEWDGEPEDDSTKN